MAKINEIVEYIRNMTVTDILNIWIAVAIVIVFMIFRGALAYIVIKIFKLKEKKSKKIKSNAFYIPLKSFFGFLGIYLAIVFLSEPLNISQDLMNIITKIFRIVVIIATAVGLANSITTKASFITKIQEKSDRDIDKSTVRIIIRVIRVAIYIVAGVMVIADLGYNLNGLIAGLGLGSLVITLAAQDTVKNLLGGLTLVLDKPLNIGDYIIINTIEGTVEDIGFRTTKVRTIDNSMLYVPNSIMVASALINCSQKSKNRYRKIISLDAENHLEKIEECKKKILEVLQAHEMVEQDNIIIKFAEISPKGMDLLIDCFINTVEFNEYLAIKEDINYKIMQVFNNEGVKLASNYKQSV